MMSNVAIMPTKCQIQNIDILKTDTQNEIKISNEQKQENINTVNKEINSIMQVNLNSLIDKQEVIYMIEKIGIENIFKSVEKSKILNINISELTKLSNKDGNIVSELTKLQEQMNLLNPDNINFNKKNIFGGMHSSVKKYFKKYENIDEFINSIINSLQKSKKQLKADNITLEIEQQLLKDLTKNINIETDYCIELENQIKSRIDSIKSVNGDKNKIIFLEEEILYRLQQKIYNFNQMLIVNQQGIVAMEMLKRNNKELIFAIERAQTVTVSALRIAINIATNIYHQKLTIEKIEQLNLSTNKITSATSNLIKEQKNYKNEYNNIQNELNNLSNAFNEALNVLDDISQYNNITLPQIEEQVQEFKILSQNSEEKINKLKSINN